MRESTRKNWETFWEEKQNMEEVYSNGERILRNLSQVIDLKGKRVLEIGAGTGRDSFPLARVGADVTQLDYSEESLKILRRLAEEQGYKTTIIGGDAFAMPFADESFDIVFHQGLLEHFRSAQAEKLLRENIRVLKPGGLLLVDVPQRYHIYTLVKHFLIAINKWFAGWERSFSVGELRKVMRQLGLTPVYAYGEWMAPSFFYRATREVALKFGIKLPLYPVLIPTFSEYRAHMRQALWKTPLPLWTGLSIGVIGKK